MFVDYFGLWVCFLNIDDFFFYDKGGLYWYINGYNVLVLVVFVVSIVLNILGFLVFIGVLDCLEVFIVIYSNVWFVGFCLVGFVYWILLKRYLLS